MGGVGKTALAKKLYDEGDVRKWFGGNVCFVFVGGKSTCSRQEQILRELCDVDVSIENPMAGRAAIKEKLHRRKVFLCLDDVTNATEVVRVEDLGPGSRVVTTSRSKEATSSLEYKVELLDSDASWKLFCWHAFGGKNPPEDLALLCSEVMNLCKGLPLAIKVLARQLMAAEDHHKRRLLEEILRPRVEETRQEASDLLWGGYKALEPAALQDSLVLLAGMWPNSREFRECESVVRSLAAAVYGEEPDARLRLEAARRALKSLVDRGLIQLGGQKDSPWVTVHDLVQEVALRAIKESMRFCRIEKVASALPPQQLGELGAEHVVLELGPSERLSESFFATVSSTKSYVLFGGPGGHVQLPKLLKPGLIGCRLLSIGGLQGGARRRRLKRELVNLQCLNGQLIGKAGLVEMDTLLQTALSGDGVADLSDRSLDSFPLENWHRLPVASTLGTLKHLILDNNDLRSLPAALGQLVSLEFLSVENNLLTRLPAELSALIGLKTLGLGRNHLEVFPSAVRRMVSLRSLFLSGNKLLKELPDWFSRSCPRLIQLDVGSCAFSSFPSVLLDAHSLQTLDLSGGAAAGGSRFNVPPDFDERVARSCLASTLKVLSLGSLGLSDSSLGWIGALTSLRSLDLRGNQLVSLPRFIADMPNLSELKLADNEALVTPPREVARRGLASIRAYLDEMSLNFPVSRTFIRVMFVGWQSAGKTKLNFALQGRLAEYSGKSTFGIDTSSWEPDWAVDGNRRIAFSSWDFAGQRGYYALHRFFLTERALYLFLVDLSPEDFEETVAENVRFWLDSLNKHTWGATVRVVGTKVDRILDRYGVAAGPVEVDRRRDVLWRHIRDEEARVVAALEAKRGVFEGARLALEARPTLPRCSGDILLCSLPQEVVPRESAEEEEPLADEVGHEGLAAAWGVDETPHAEAGNVRERKVASPNGEAAAVAAPAPSGDAIRQEVTLESETWKEVVGGSPYDSARLLAQLRGEVLEIATESRFHLYMPPSYVALMEEVEKRKLRCQQTKEACSVSEAEWRGGPAGGERGSRNSADGLGPRNWGSNRAGAGHGSEAGDGAEGTDGREYLSWEAYREIMQRTCGFHSEENLKEATRLLHDLGVLLWYDGRPDCPGLGEKVLLRPDWVLDLLTPIVGHELGEQFAPGGADRGWKAGRTDDLIKALESKGILFHDLLDLLPAIRKLSEEGFRAPADELKQYVLYLLRSFGLAYPSRDDSFDYVPMRCQDQTPADLFGVGFPRASMAAEPPSAQLFGKRVHFEFGVPEGFAENVVVSLQTQLVHHFGGEGLPCIVQQWEHGTLFQACVRPGGAADNHNGARIRILLRVPQEGGARDVFELLWMLSEPGEAGSPTFVASEELAAHVNRWLSHFLEEKVVGLVSEVFCPYLVPLYEELVGCKGQVLDAEPATNGELGGHSAAGSLEEMSLEGMYTWQRDQRLSARARQLSTGKGGPASLSDREPTVKDDSLGFEESRSSQIAQEWELVPDDLLTMKQGQLNLSFTRLGARQAVYFSHFFSNRLVELNVSNASLGGMHVDLTPNRQLKILNAGFNNICVIQKGNWTLPESLESLFLYRNGLSSVPAHVSSLPSIANFNGDGNELVSFPDLNESVRTLSLSHNRFSSLPQKRLRHFGKLSVLDLKGNSLSKLPSEIGLLVALEQLLLSQNHLEELPSEIGDLPWLRVLDVAYNRLQTLPETVGRLTQLEELFVGYQGVSLRAKGQNGHPGEKAGVSGGLVGGTVAFALPETLVGDGLKSLRVLASQRNKMGPSLPVWVCKLRTLVELDVEDNNLEFLPDNDSFLSGLVASGSWSWRSAYMVGGGQKSRLALPALEILCLSRNPLTSFPGWIGESRQCRVIEANGNMLERIPVEFHRLHRLEVLELGGNQELGFVKAVQEGPHAVRRACHLRLVRARAFSLSASFLMALLALVFASSLPRALGQGEASCAAPRARGHSAHPVPLDLLSVGLLFVLVLLVRLWEAVGWVALGVAPTSSGAARNAASNHPPELRDEEEEWLFQTQSGSAFPANDPELQSPPSEGRAVSLAPIQSLSVKLSISASELALEENGAAELAAFEFDGEDERSAAKNDVGSNGGGMHKQGKDADPLTRTSAGGGDGTPFALDEGERGEETDLLLAVERAQAARRLSAPAQRGGDAVNMQSPSEPQDPDMGHPNGCAQAFAIRQEEDGLRFAAPKRLAILEGGGCCTLTASGREVSKRLARSGEAPAQSGATKPENRAQSDDASGCTNRRASFAAASRWSPPGSAAPALRLAFLLLLALLPVTFADSPVPSALALGTRESARVEIHLSLGSADIHLSLTPAELLAGLAIVVSGVVGTILALVLLVTSSHQPAPPPAPPSPAPSPNPAASPSQDPGKTVGPRYVRTFEWPVTPDQKPVCPKLHKDVAKQGRVVDRVLQKPTRGGAVTVYSTCTINHPADFKEMGQPLKVVTVTLKVYSQHHRLPELLGEDKEKDHGFYQEKMRVNLRPKDPRGYKKQPAVPNTDDFQRQVDKTCKNTQGIEANGVLEFTGVFPFVKVSGGGERTSASEALTAVRELERPIVVQEEGAVSNKQEFTWSICLGREHERSALLANGEVKRRIVPPEQGPIVEDYCTNLTAVWLVKASEVEMQLEVEVERMLKYVRIMKDRPAFLKYLVKEKNVGLDVVQNGIAMIRWGFKAGSGDMQVNI